MPKSRFWPLRMWIGIALAVAFLAGPAVAFAGWNTAPETIENHPTWVYTPDRTAVNGKRALLVVLHGCGQTNTELKDFGNLTGAADEKGVVVALPGVGDNPFGPGCWNYDLGEDGGHHVADITRLAKTLIGRGALQIDPKAVYVVGVSSGASLSLLLGCAAPDVFAGIGAMEGPSVGSPQAAAVLDGRLIPLTTVSVAIETCKALAGRKSAFFRTQVANIAYGDMDRNGTKARYYYQRGATDHPGQYLFVSTKWSEDNVRALQQIYGTGKLGPETTVQGGGGSERAATAGGHTRIALLVVHDVGHAWPAGTGEPNSASAGGLWMAQKSLNYPRYIIDWFTRNNLRTGSR